MTRFSLLCLIVLGVAPSAAAQTTRSPILGDSAREMIGTWEFSNAERDKICTVAFKKDQSPVGFALAFDKNCGSLFPLVNDVVGWNFPDNDLLRLLDAQGKTLIEFSEVEDGIYEAPTPGIGVLFLQISAAAGVASKSPEQLAGDWTIKRGTRSLCMLTLMTTAAQEGLALKVKPGCDPAIARLNLGMWQIDRDEVMLIPLRGNPWRFEEAGDNIWRRVPESAQDITLVRP